ncbi:hypothetical protein ACHAP5_010977 [Fusarium lateritium]
MEPNETSELGTIELLDTEHFQAFEQALMRVLGTDIAEKTFAQIIDGLPTYESYAEFHWPQDGHPATHHTKLCSGMLDKAREFRSAFASEFLNFKLPPKATSCFCRNYSQLKRVPPTDAGATSGIMPPDRN